MLENRLVSFEEIKKVLPHRYPFLLVDKVLSLTADHIRALKNVTNNEPFFNGHFPELAVMPGVLQVEAMAQTAGLILALSDGFDVAKQIALLAGIDDARFKKMVVPGDQLIIEARVLAKKSSILKVRAKALVNDEVASSADIVLVIKPI